MREFFEKLSWKRRIALCILISANLWTIMGTITVLRQEKIHSLSRVMYYRKGISLIGI